jgi:carboxymethylenebutenolidase
VSSIAEYLRLGPDATSTGGYLALPKTDGPAPAIVLTTAIAGINDYIERVAEQLAAEGYLAFALDYFARTGGPPDLSGMDKIMAAVADLDDPVVLNDMRLAIDWLRARPDCDGRVGSVGFCIGGTYSLLAAAEIPELAAAVCFYGTLRYAEHSEKKPRSPLEAAADVVAPVLAHYGDEDHLVSQTDAEELASGLKGKPAQVYTYPGAGHAFHEDFRPPVHRPVAAAEAWQRTTTFMRCYLTSEYTATA